MKTKFVIYIPVGPKGITSPLYAGDSAAVAKGNLAAANKVTWGKLLTEGWRVVKFEGRKGV